MIGIYCTRGWPWHCAWSTVSEHHTSSACMALTQRISERVTVFIASKEWKELVCVNVLGEKSAMLILADIQTEVNKWLTPPHKCKTNSCLHLQSQKMEATLEYRLKCKEHEDVNEKNTEMGTNTRECAPRPVTRRLTKRSSKKKWPNDIKIKADECYQQLAVAVTTNYLQPADSEKCAQDKRQPDSGFDANKQV